MSGKPTQAREKRAPCEGGGLFDGEGRGLIEPGSIKVALETEQSRYEKVLGITVGDGPDLE